MNDVPEIENQDQFAYMLELMEVITTVEELIDGVSTMSYAEMTEEVFEDLKTGLTLVSPLLIMFKAGVSIGADVGVDAPDVHDRMLAVDGVEEQLTALLDKLQ